ncbi:MAG: 30S ribosomal protein S15 [Elusimicrobia bacterium]|nr:30S ribosomal protein S15 [Elusimicrobiota bacterium]
MTNTHTQELMAKFQKHPKDSGSPAVQIALLSERIRNISEHLKNYPKDHHSRAGLLKQVGHRKRLLNYLKQVSSEEHQKLIKSLDLRK